MDDAEWSGDEQKFISSEQKRLAKTKSSVSLAIEDFGPITKIQIDIKKVTLILGKNNTGKSIIAKLACILMDIASYSLDKENFFKKLDDLDIGVFLKKRTRIVWITAIGSIIFEKGVFRSSVDAKVLDKAGLETYSNLVRFLNMEKKIRSSIDFVGKVKTNKTQEQKDAFAYLQKSLEELDGIKKNIGGIQDMMEVFYIPAERDFVSVISGAVFSALRNNLPISNAVLNFASKFEQLRSEKNKLDIDFLNISFSRQNNEDQIELPNNEAIHIGIASSGIKSVVPAYIVLSALENRKASFVALEEPENNLHPTAQKHFTSLVSRFCSQGEMQMLTVTTHSPYVLSAFNNLIQAGTLADEKAELVDDISKIIPKESWIKFQDVSAYILEDGSARSILDEEWKGIIAEEIDKASDEIGDEYERLLELKYRNNKND